MNIMQNIPISLARSTLRAFTLLESLLTLFVISFLAISLSGSVQTVFRAVQTEIFLWEFEYLYKESQQLAAGHQESVSLKIGKSEISNGYQTVVIPETVKPLEEMQVTFDEAGGNSSLAKIGFTTGDRTISYQLYLGSGRYKKTED